MSGTMSEKLNSPKKSGKEQPEALDVAETDPFVLEQLFPKATELFLPLSADAITSNNVLVALDTNALLLPYSFDAGDLDALAGVYEKLFKDGRLFVPDRVAREFIRRRDRTLADMVQALHDRKKELPSGDMPPLLKGIDGYEDAVKSYESLKAARIQYMKALDTLVKKIESWRGDDPVAKMYSTVFQAATIVELPLGPEQQKQYLTECKWRYAHNIPPGYKDRGKDDGGVGDFLIWKALLLLGEKHKKDLVFVTGEQKADWFVRTGGKGIYPRSELIEEYRRASEGKTLRLMNLYELLNEMNVPQAVVEKVKLVEEEANTAIQFAAASRYTVQGGPAQLLFRGFGKKTFDYSTNDGVFQVGEGETLFALRFSKASNTGIHLYKTDNVTHIARVKDAVAGQYLKLSDYDSTSRTYLIGVGERFLARNSFGRLLTGKILSIKDDTRGDDRDEAVLAFGIADAEADRVPAL